MPAWPTVSIEISFDSDCIPAFLQSDADFVFGVGWTGTPATWTAVTTWVLRWGYTRGRQRQLGRTEAGTAYLELDNADGRFDPTNVSGPYYLSGAGMRPGKHVRIRATWNSVTYDLFYGFITRLTLQGEETSTPTVRIELADMIAWFARGTFSWDYGIGLTGTIIGFLLQETLLISASTFTLIDPGVIQTADEPASTGNPWSEIQAVADTEEGVAFVDGAGRFVYHDHNHRTIRERSIVLQAILDKNETAQAAGSLPFTTATFSDDDAEFYTRVIVTRQGGTPQTVTIDTNGLGSGFSLPDRYFVRPFSRSTRNLNDTSALNTARRLADRFRVFFLDHSLQQHTDVAIQAGDDLSALWSKALGLTISDQIEVTQRLWGGRSRTIRSFVEGMTADVVVKDASWTVRYQLSRALTAYHWNIRGKGVAFPLSPASNDVYYREDLDLLCFYDGTRWLTINEYSADFQPYNSLPPFSAIGTVLLYAPRVDYALYVTRWHIRTNVLTTNNGSNFWSITLVRDGTTIASTSTSSDTAGTPTLKTASLNAVQNPVTFFGYNLAKTGAPGNIELHGSFAYRLVIT